MTNRVASFGTNTQPSVRLILPRPFTSDHIQDRVHEVTVDWKPFTFALAGMMALPPMESMLVTPTVARLYTLTVEPESMFKIWLWQLVVFKQAWS